MTPRWLALTREVSPAIQNCALTHLERQVIDHPRAAAQHQQYLAALTALGARVECLPADPALADSVFVEDAAVVTDAFAVLTRSGNPDRRAEVALVGEHLTAHRPLFHILAPGTLDGGDVLRLERTLYVGVGKRTNSAGFEQLRSIARQHGYEARAVPLSDCLHLKTAVTAVAGGTLLINPVWVDERYFPSFAFIRVDPREPFAANALWLGDSLIYSSAHVHTGEKLRQHGISLRLVDVSELAKAEAGVTCCSILMSLRGV